MLLLAAFAAANALSLVSIIFVGLGMALGPRAQQVGLQAPTMLGRQYANDLNHLATILYFCPHSMWPNIPSH